MTISYLFTAFIAGLTVFIAVKLYSKHQMDCCYLRGWHDAMNLQTAWKEHAIKTRDADFTQAITQGERYIN